MGSVPGGRRPAREFDWLWEIYYTEKASYLLEWDLALRMVLEKLRFHVERGERSYKLIDSSGQERRFDFIRGGPAEKIFLKLLFPVDGKTQGKGGRSAVCPFALYMILILWRQP